MKLKGYPFTHRIETVSRLLATSEPSAATARLQVIRMSCDLAGPMPATKLLSHKPGFECLDRAGHGCCMMGDAPRVLIEATDVNVGFRYARAHGSQPPRWCRTRVCVRPEAPCHAAAKAFSCCVPPATVRLLVDADSDKCRLP